MRKRVGRRLREREQEEMTKEEALRLWEEARPVEVERRRAESSVLSVRLSHHVFDELVEEARRQGKGPATLARELIEEGLARREDTSPALLLETLARLFRNLELQKPRVRLTDTWRGLVVESRPSVLEPGLWAAFGLGRPGALLPKASTGAARAPGEVELEGA
jgi:predicted DNA-binding protein